MRALGVSALLCCEENRLVEVRRAVGLGWRAAQALLREGHEQHRKGESPKINPCGICEHRRTIPLRRT